MNSRIKIVHIQLLPMLSGVQRVTLQELSNLDDKVFERYIICKEPGPLSLEASKHGIKCIYIPSLTRDISLVQDVRAFYHLCSLFKRYDFDIVHTHSSKTGVLGRVAARLFGVKKIFHTVHGFAFPATKSKISKALYYTLEYIGGRAGHFIICLNKDDANIAENKLKIRANKVHVLPNGIDVKHYHPVSIEDKELLRRKTNIPVNKFVVGMVGRLWEQKDPSTFIDAALELSYKQSNVHFVVVGDGDLFDELLNRVNAADLDNFFSFLGWRNDIPQILSTLDVFVLPSLWEGMPLAILEAQSCGLPCLVTNIQGNRSLVSNGQNGFLFEPKDTKRLVDLLERLRVNVQLRKRLGNAARVEIIENFDLRERVKKIVKLYRETC